MWEIALVIAAILFCVTCLFLIGTLISLQRSLVKLEHLSEEATKTLRVLEAQLVSLNSTFRTISNLGDIAETKTFQLKENYLERPSNTPPVGDELVNLALLGARLYKRFFK